MGYQNVCDNRRRGTCFVHIIRLRLGTVGQPAQCCVVIQRVYMSNNNINTLKSSIEALKQLRLEIHDDVDESVLLELDKIIDDLESCKHSLSNAEILKILGRYIGYLSAVKKLLEVFYD